MANVDAVQDVIRQIAQLTDKQRATLMNHLVDTYESTVVKLFSRFHKCDSCDQMVTKITHECQTRNGYVESCCDWCATLCVCAGATTRPTVHIFMRIAIVFAQRVVSVARRSTCRSANCTETSAFDLLTFN